MGPDAAQVEREYEMKTAQGVMMRWIYSVPLKHSCELLAGCLALH